MTYFHGSTAQSCMASAQMVGIAEGVFGIFCVASGLPAGWLADHMRRDRLLRIFGCLMLGALQPVMEYGTARVWSPTCTSVGCWHPSRACIFFGHQFGLTGVQSL